MCMCVCSSSRILLPLLPRVDYACIPQPSCEIPLRESLLPEEISRKGSFFESFISVSKSFEGGGSEARSEDNADLVEALQAQGQTVVPDNDETKGEPQRKPINRQKTSDHRHTSANSQGSMAKHWLGEAVKVRVHPQVDGRERERERERNSETDIYLERENMISMECTDYFHNVYTFVAEHPCIH